MKLKCAVVGVGYWNHYVRILKNNPNVELSIVCDKNHERIKDQFDVSHPFIQYTTNLGDVLKSDAEAVIVCTPVTTHFQVVAEILDAKKHVLCEKAFTVTPEESEALIFGAKERNLTLSVGHTYRFNTYVQEIKKIIDSGKLGDVYYVSMTRMGKSPIRNDVGCTTDLAAHDISMLLYWFVEMPKSVSTFGKSYLSDDREDVSFTDLEFSKNVIANIRCSWVNPIKRRNITIVGSNGMISFDDIEKTLLLYDKDYQYVQSIEYKEPLKEQVNDFIEAVQQKRQPLVTGEDGMNVVRVLEACNKSMRNNSEKVYL